MNRLDAISSFQLNLFRNGDCFKMGVCIAITLVWARFSWCLHGFSISNAIASLLLHRNEPNKIDSEITQRDEEAGPNPILPAEFV
jgi:hypothetical protein